MLKLNDGRSELWQWDTGRKLKVNADCSQVHFSNKVFGRSLDVDVVDGVAEIPDILLQTDRDLIAWAFVGTAENGYTKIGKTFKVNRRNKPADYVFTPPDQTSIEKIKERLEDLESIQDPDAIKNAVEDYLEQNPPEMPGIPTITAKRYSDNTNGTGVMVTTTNYNADGSVTINSELVYDGDDYVLTDTDKAEIAEQAAALVEAPDSGGNVDQTTTFSGDMFSGYDRFYDSIARMQVNPTEPLNIVTYDGSNKPTHPKVLYVENGWAGHKYWMTYTPFPGNDNTYENPCIAYSEDGVNFISDGITNPIENTPMEDSTKVGYNSDSHLVMVNGVMECWWRTHYQSGTNAEHEVIYRKKSTDGIAWSEKEELFRVNDASAGSCLSPAVIYEDGIYKIWTVYKQQFVRYYESTTGADWAHIRDISVDNPDYSTYKIWHIDVIHTDKGYEFVGCYRPTNDYNDNKYIYYAMSEDNVTYSKRVLILTPGKTGNFDATELYRPSILRLNNKVRIYYGCRNGWGNWKIGMIEAPTPYLFNAVLKNGLRFDSLESRLSALESGSGGTGGEEETEKTLTGISATYSGGDVEAGTAVSALTGVVVIATYSDGSTETVTGYTLTGTIAEGSNVITVNYSGLTTTFTVTGIAGSGGGNGETDIVNTWDEIRSGGTWIDGSGGTYSDIANPITEWTKGYYNDSGEIVEELNMHHSNKIATAGMESVVVYTSVQYLRISYFDENESFIGWDRGFGLGTVLQGADGSTRNIRIRPDYGAYFVINANTTNQADIMCYNAYARYNVEASPVAEYVSDTGKVLSMDGVDDKLLIPLTGAKTVTIEMKPLRNSGAGNAYIFDCRKTVSAYMLNYSMKDFIGDDATVYVGNVPLRGNEKEYDNAVITGNWHCFTIVFNQAFTGNMHVCCGNAGSDFMPSEIKEIKVYDVDVTAA